MRLRGAESRVISADLLMWKDQFARRDYGSFVTYDTSPLYQLLDGETILIRFDPVKPNRYYNRPRFVGWLLHLSKAAIAVEVDGDGSYAAEKVLLSPPGHNHREIRAIHSPSSLARRFIASRQNAMCASRSTPSSAAP